MAREQIPITPSVLSWARERARYSIDEVREEFRDIEAWETPQLERLSDTFKISVAVFFFPEPPNIPPIRESFRTLPDAQFEQIPLSLQFLLRKARALQISLAELNDGRNPAENFILRDIVFNTDIAVRRSRPQFEVTWASR